MALFNLILSLSRSSYHTYCLSNSAVFPSVLSEYLLKRGGIKLIKIRDKIAGLVKNLLRIFTYSLDYNNAI